MAARKHYMTVISEHTGERVVSPGEILTNELHRQHITQKDLAIMLGRSEKFISQLITGKVRLTYDVAFDLERVLGVPTAKWNAAEAAVQDELTRRARKAALDTPEVHSWAAGFPYDKMAEQGMVPATGTPVERAANLLSYFGVSSPEAYEACCRQQKGLAHFKQRKEAVDAL